MTDIELDEELPEWEQELLAPYIEQIDNDIAVLAERANIQYWINPIAGSVAVISPLVQLWADGETIVRGSE